MNKIVVSGKVNYDKQEVDELERASLLVQSIYDRAALLAMKYYLSLHKSFPTAPQPQPQAYFQKWIYTAKGWKYIGSEHQTESTNQALKTNLKTDTVIREEKSELSVLDENGSFHSWMSLFLQALIWTQYEEIRLFHPFLGADGFYSEDELNTIATYFIPTYFSEKPLRSYGKTYRKRNLVIPVYQEEILPSSVFFDTESSRIEGPLTTGVYISEKQFKGLGPYFKSLSGNRIYMKASVQQS